MSALVFSLNLLKHRFDGNDDAYFAHLRKIADEEEAKGNLQIARQVRALIREDQSVDPVNYRHDAVIQPQHECEHIVEKTWPRTALADLILPESITRELEQIVLGYRNQIQLRLKQLQPRSRGLLIGPPGSGKTASAAAIAGELRQPLFLVQWHELVPRFQHDAATTLSELFGGVRSQCGVYLFEDIGSMAAGRKGENLAGRSEWILRSFFKFMERDVSPSIVMATTSIPDVLNNDELWRFDVVLRYELPDHLDIAKLLYRTLVKFRLDGVDTLAVSTEALGLSTCDVILAFTDAAQRAHLSSTDGVSTSNLISALRRRKNAVAFGSTSGWNRFPAHFASAD